MIYRKYTSENIKTVESIIHHTEEHINKIRSIITNERIKTKAVEYITDAFLFHVLFHYDVLVLYKNFMSSKSPFEQAMIFRQLASLFYEYMEDTYQVMGKKFESAIRNDLSESNYQADLKKIRQLLNTFKDKHYDKFKDIRNSVGAHRDQDPHLQLAIIDKLVIEEAEFCVKNFLKINGMFLRFYPGLIHQLTKPNN